ncbi:MAG: winged helix-turn-helix domain-containing protein [Planctomycetota bacterium]|nr:winged helix-turn-helix domain-containing protein [Planctomycetota bacterium]
MAQISNTLGASGGASVGASGLIDRPAQVRALASPARQEIVDALEAAWPCTIAELAGLVGRPADALYFHVKRLIKVGLIVETAARERGVGIAAKYDVVARPLRLSYGPGIARRDIVKVVAAAVRQSAREYEAAARDPLVAGDGPDRLVRGGRAKGWLTPVETRRAMKLLDDLAALMRAGKPRRGARPMAFGYLLAPCEVRERA